uniref:Uncharacterized protein n=1 Tax=Anopheles culicifacies TaxID=139723 RepID=A0A182M8X4_9DIPT
MRVPPFSVGKAPPAERFPDVGEVHIGLGSYQRYEIVVLQQRLYGAACFERTAHTGRPGTDQILRIEAQSVRLQLTLWVGDERSHYCRPSVLGSNMYRRLEAQPVG